MYKWLQKEINWWNKDIKIKEWMPVCLAAGTCIFSFGLVALVFVLTGRWFGSATLLSTSLVILVGVALLFIYSWHYVKLNPKEPKV